MTLTVRMRRSITDRSQRDDTHDLTLRVDRRIWALVPARNEEASIVETIESLLVQTVVPWKIVVVADSCTDRTVEMVGNTFGDCVHLIVRSSAPGKSHALNTAFTFAAEHGAVFVVAVDADTICHPRFVENAVAEMRRDPHVGGVGGRCLPQPLLGSTIRRMLWRAQYHEYAREDSARVDRLGAVDIVPGAAMMLRVAAVREVGGWAADSLVEDHRLSIELRRREWRTIVGFECFCLTGPPETIRQLWRQRRRWYGGVITEVRRYGAHEALGFGRNQYYLNNIGALGLMVSIAVLAGFAANRTPLPVGVAIVPALSVGVVDQFIRLRYLPQRRFSDVAWALSPLPSLYAMFRQMIWIASLVRPKRRRW